MVIKINEMAYSRKVIVERCANLGKQFIEHFNTVCSLSKSDQDFKHHCHEMQTWYDDVSSLKLKETSRCISKVNKIDWFFTVGKDIEDIIPEDFQDIYEQLILDLLTGKSVYDSLSNLL